MTDTATITRAFPDNYTYYYESEGVEIHHDFNKNKTTKVIGTDDAEEIEFAVEEMREVFQDDLHRDESSREVFAFSDDENEQPMFYKF